MAKQTNKPEHNKEEKHLIDVPSAVQRENAVRENGLADVPMWVFLIMTVVALVAGGVMLSGGGSFSYDDYVRPGYVQLEEASGGAVEVPKGEAHDVYMAIGKEKYSACVACHQANGEGVPGAFPPLAGSEWVLESPHIPLLVASNGLNGHIQVKGKSYNAAMNSIGVDKWKDVELASLVYFLQNSWGNKVGKVYSVDQIQQFREINEKRAAGTMTTAAELEKLKGKAFTGDLLEAETIINRKTGEILTEEE